MYERYGYGGLRYPLFDLGCLGTAGNWTWNSVANLELRGMVWATALGGFMRRSGQSSIWWDTLDPVVESSQVLAQRLLWGNGGIITLAGILLACSLGYLGWQRKVSMVLHLAVMAAVVLVIGHLAAFDGVNLVHTLRDTTVAVTSVFTSDPDRVGDSDIVHRELLYRTWLAGMFGDADSPVAQEYGPRLFDCGVFRFDEAQTVEVEQGKLDCVHQIMGELDKNHRVEAQYAHGGKSLEQAGTAFQGLIGAVAVAFWDMFAGGAGLILFLLITFVVPALMFVVVLAMFKDGQKTFLRPLFDMVAGAIIRMIICTITGQIVAAAAGAVLGSATIPWPMRIVLLVLILAVSIGLTKHHRRLTGGRVDAALNVTLKRFLSDMERVGTVAAGVAVGMPPTTDEGWTGKTPKKFLRKDSDVVAPVAEQAIPERPAPAWVAPRAALGRATTIPQPAGSQPAGALLAGPPVGEARVDDNAGVVSVGTIPAGTRLTKDLPVVVPAGVDSDKDRVARRRRLLAAAIENRAGDIEPGPARQGELDHWLTGGAVLGADTSPIEGWIAPATTKPKDKKT